MKPKLYAALAAILALLWAGTFTTHAATIAYWNFEDGVNGQPFTPIGEPDGSGGSVDTVNSILMRGWSSTAGPSWTAATYGTGLGANMANGAQDGYVTEGALHSWGPTAWTIELMINLRVVDGWRTLIGRDGSTLTEPAADFYLQNNGIDNRFRINYVTESGVRRVLDGDYAVQINTWYSLAIVSDGTTLAMWLDDGAGYTQIGFLDMSDQTPANNALRSSALNWTFGRGWYNGGLVDHIDGKMDNVRFSDTALTPSELLKFPNNVFISTGPTPASQTVALGAPASFSIEAGGEAPVYQWRKNGTPISGASNPTYSIAATVLGDAGNYDVVITNSFSAVTSSVATLTIHIPRPLTWGGVAGAWDTTAANWTTNNGGSFLAYFETDHVRFDPLGAAQPLVTLSAARNPSSVTVSNGSYTFAGASITSSGALSLENNATLRLATNNTFGGLAISSGSTLHLNGNSQTVGSLSGGGLITSTNAAPVLTMGSANLNTTWSGTITNSGGNPSFIKIGTGTNTFSGSNYLAGTAASQVNGGALIVPTGGAIVPQGTAELWIGQGATTGRVEVTGGYVGANNWFVVGRANAAANGTLVLNSGTVQKTGGGNFVVGSLGGTGTVIVNGGQILNNANLWLGENAGANATLFLNGGLVQATQVRIQGGVPATSIAYFNGGTLQASAASTDFIPAPTIGVIQAGGLVFDNNGFDITITSMLVEDNQTPSTGGGLTKLGAGALTLAGGYNYTGPTIVRGGTLSLNPASGLLFSSPNLVVSNATLTVAAGGFTSLNAGTATLGNNAVLNLNYGLLSGNPTWAAIAASGSLSAPGTTVTINLTGSGWNVGTVPLITYSGPTLGSIANFVLNLPPGLTANLVNTPNSLNLQITAAINLTWYGNVNNVWDINTTANWADNAVPGSTYKQGDPVRLDDTAVGNFGINLTASVNPASVTVDAGNSYSITGAGGIGGGTSVVKNNTGTLVLNTVNTYTGGTIISGGTLAVNNATALGNPSGTVSLQGGTLQFGASTTSSHPFDTPVTSTIDVVAGATAQLNNTVSGAGRLNKSGAGTLALGGVGVHTGPLSVLAGTVNMTGGTSSFINGPSYVGYVNGQATMNLTGGSNYFGGNFRVGGSDQSGFITTTGTVTIANSTLSVGSLAIARGNNIQNTAVGTVTVNSGGTLNSEGDIVLDFAGNADNEGILNVNAGGTVNVATTIKRWLIMSQWDFGDATLNINGGQLNLNANTDLRFGTGNNNGTNIVNLNSGAITFYSDNKTTVGGNGVVDMHQGSGASTNIFNLNGGVLSTFGVVTANNSGARAFNFNGGTLRAIANNAAFFTLGTGNAAANVRNGGAIIDTGGFNVTIPYLLRHSTIAGDNAIDGGLTKLGTGTLTLSASNTYSGNTTISNGTLIITTPYLADAANVNIGATGKLQMNFAGTDMVNGLTIAGVPKANGTYGATGSGATNIDDVHFAGTGVLQVGPPAPTLGVSQAGNVLTFTWTGSYKLVAQTNSLSVGLQPGGVWHNVPGGGTSGVMVTMDPAQPTVFFGLTQP